jgi:hypothetical protein
MRMLESLSKASRAAFSAKGKPGYSQGITFESSGDG